jgi:drug/metabolite transporter (DMT)-like permease
VAIIFRVILQSNLVKDMEFLVLSVVCSVVLGVLFKLFPRLGVDSFQAIVFNYFTCLGCGWLHLGFFPVLAEGMEAPWVPYAGLLGVIFIIGFNAAAQTVKHFGVTISQIMQKMSILITVPFAVVVIGEAAGLLRIAGFLLALAAIVLVNWPERRAGAPTPGRWWLPLLTWVFSGIIEVGFLWVKHRGLADTAGPVFLTNVFTAAGLIGIMVASIGWYRGLLVFSWRNILGGIALGIPNYGSLLFLLMALGQGLGGAFVFPVINVGIILATTLVAVVFFSEKPGRLNWVGLGLALLALALISG